MTSKFDVASLYLCDIDTASCGRTLGLFSDKSLETNVKDVLEPLISSIVARSPPEFGV